jgi:hypothetical protein
VKPIRCQYCGGKAKIVTGDKIYPDRPQAALRQYARCAPCGAHVGFHDDGRVLGELADRSTRTLRMLTHRRVDALWLPFRRRQRMRRAVYNAMAQVLSIEASACHIASLNVAQLERVIIAVKRGELQRLIAHLTDREQRRVQRDTFGARDEIHDEVP